MLKQDRSRKNIISVNIKTSFVRDAKFENINMKDVMSAVIN